MGHSYFGDELVVELVAGPAVEVVADDPHFRLPTQPKVVAGWEGGEGTPQGGKFWAQVQTKVRGDTGQTAKGEKKGKKEKKEKKENKEKKERRRVGAPKIAQKTTRIARWRRRTIRGQWRERSTEDTRRGS